MSRSFNTFLILCIYYATVVQIHAADVLPELTLSNNFHLGKMIGMPCTESLPGFKIKQRDYPANNAIEWQVHLQSPTDGTSPLYENLKSADFIVNFPTDKQVTLHWNKGSHSEASDFQPRIELLSKNNSFSLASFGGRSSDGVMPYFNLSSEGGGLIVAVGWPGDWKTSFESVENGKVRITAGLKRSRFKLAEGETVRLPSVLVMSYRGDWIDGQNKFRHLMLHHFTPKSHSPMELMPVAASVHGIYGFNDTSELKLTTLAKDIAALKLPLDTFWLDAGWNEGGFPKGQGNPNADPVRFPHGLKPVGEAVRKTDMNFLAWFEPERVMRGTWLDHEHTDWLLTPSNTPDKLNYMQKDGFLLLDFGNEQALHWALDSISNEIRDAGITVLRMDFNEYPSFFWHTNEPDNEIGLREVRYINGLYDFLDQLTRRHPGLIIDNCASGGRRLDFEMMRRSVVLWRSDNCWDDKTFPRNMQAMTHGLSHWLPLHGVGAHTTDDVALRSGMGACASFPVNFHDPNIVNALRAHLSRYLKIRPLFAADYYPLTKWSDNPNHWLAFQFHDPSKGEGIVQAFCGGNSTSHSISLKLKGLDPNHNYVITDWDTPSLPTKQRGSDLTNIGITLHAKDHAHQAIVLHYKIQ